MNYQVTGNERVSLPTIRECDGALESINFLYMQLKGMLELCGTDAFLMPYISVGGEKQTLHPSWTRSHYWVPTFTSEQAGTRFSCTYLSPVEERGFIVRLIAENISSEKKTIAVGVNGEWAKTLHSVNESIELNEGRFVKTSHWNHMFVYYQNPGTPLLAFAPITEDHQAFGEFDQGAEWSEKDFGYDIHKERETAPGEKVALDIFFGVGFEEVAACASAIEMLRQGYDTLLDRTEKWLSAREKHVEDQNLQEKLNTNLFFSFFYASGRTIDTEELCLMTSRSPRYYVSAAYWDRDSLLWAFPAICETDLIYARELLMSVFSRQYRNFGVHSRYIDGTVLEPGFELDELCAPVIAVERYIRKSNDRGILDEPVIQNGFRTVISKLAAAKHPEAALYRTFLQPSDDMHHYPYLIYDNVLAWFAFKSLGEFLNDAEFTKQADNVKQAITENFAVTYEGKPIYAWSVDMKGNWDIYDEPAGSVQLLPFYGFCESSDERWHNLVSILRDEAYELSFAGHRIAEIGCKHAPFPWILSIANSMLSGHADTALVHLNATVMDNGIACESVDPDTGVSRTGDAFATCAGFLAFALIKTLEK